MVFFSDFMIIIGNINKFLIFIFVNLSQKDTMCTTKYKFDIDLMENVLYIQLTKTI